jgi:putative FmdB family regulatory protein
MPLYEYVCSVCRTRLERMRPMSEAAEPVPCPDCGAPAHRVLSVFSAFTRGEGGQTQAVAGTGGCAGCSGACDCSSCGL